MNIKKDKNFVLLSFYLFLQANNVPSVASLQACADKSLNY